MEGLVSQYLYDDVHAIYCMLKLKDLLVILQQVAVKNMTDYVYETLYE